MKLKIHNWTYDFIEFYKPKIYDSENHDFLFYRTDRIITFRKPIKVTKPKQHNYLLKLLFVGLVIYLIYNLNMFI